VEVADQDDVDIRRVEPAAQIAIQVPEVGAPASPLPVSSGTSLIRCSRPAW
jgi:hypothetical protein